MKNNMIVVYTRIHA